MNAKSRGFTLVEVLLSVTIISMLVGLSLPVYKSFQDRNDLDLTTESIANSFRRAQVYAGAVNGDSQWGVEVQGSTVTLFKGATFASRDTSYDEVTTIPGNMAVSGLSEVLFSKLSATPNTTGSVTLTANSNDIRTITINAKGMVSY